MGIEDILREKGKEILRLAALHGATNVRVFGSVTRGDARQDSDVDLLVEVGPNPSFFFLGGLVADLEELLGRHVDLVEPEGLHCFIRDRVLQEAIPL